jgi:uncharacterized membrane protein HdeD (DUF308 family)
VLFGILAFAWPGITLRSLVLAYGIYAIADGVTALAVGLVGGPSGGPWWQMIVVGVIGLYSGVLAFLWRSIPIEAFSSLVGAWAIARGVTEIIAAQELHGVVDDAWLLIIGGFCSALFGVALIAQVRADVLAKLWFIGSYATVFGVLTLALAFDLSRSKRRGATDKETGR